MFCYYYLDIYNLSFIVNCRLAVKMFVVISLSDAKYVACALCKISLLLSSHYLVLPSNEMKF